MCFKLTHTVLHHHEATFIAFKALTLKTAGRVNTRTLTAQVRGDTALVDV